MEEAWIDAFDEERTVCYAEVRTYERNEREACPGGAFRFFFCPNGIGMPAVRRPAGDRTAAAAPRTGAPGVPLPGLRPSVESAGRGTVDDPGCELHRSVFPGTA